MRRMLPSAVFVDLHTHTHTKAWKSTTLIKVDFCQSEAIRSLLGVVDRGYFGRFHFAWRNTLKEVSFVFLTVVLPTLCRCWFILLGDVGHQHFVIFKIRDSGFLFLEVRASYQNLYITTTCSLEGAKEECCLQGFLCVVVCSATLTSDIPFRIWRRKMNIF